MASNSSVGSRTRARRPTSEELVTILDEMRPIVRRFAARDASQQQFDEARDNRHVS